MVPHSDTSSESLDLEILIFPSAQTVAEAVQDVTRRGQKHDAAWLRNGLQTTHDC